MAEDGFDYPRILQRALRSVVREVLARTAAEGLPGDHHFYLSLRTDHPEVGFPPFLRERYPEEITVVLQNQFWGLTVDDQGFAVTLRFDGDPVRLSVPFDAVVAFFDPAAQFGLRFDLAGLAGNATAPERLEPATTPAGPQRPEDGDASDAPSSEAGAAGPHAVPTPEDRPAEAKVLSFERPRDRRDPE
jgi:hypothetical protein